MSGRCSRDQCQEFEAEVTTSVLLTSTEGCRGRRSCPAGVRLFVGLDEFSAEVKRWGSAPNTRIPIGKLKNHDGIGVSPNGHFAPPTINGLVFNETLTVESEKDLSVFRSGHYLKPEISVLDFRHDIGQVLRIVTRVNVNAPEPSELLRIPQSAALCGLQRQAGVDTQELDLLLRPTLQVSKIGRTRLPPSSKTSDCAAPV
jgi:hypothetical protein